MKQTRFFPVWIYWFIASMWTIKKFPEPSGCSENEGADLPYMYGRRQFLYGSVRVKFRFNSRKSPVHSSRTAPVHVRERTGVVRECFSSPIKRSRTCPGENSRIFPGVYGRNDEYISISRTPPVHLPYMYGRSAPSLTDPQNKFVFYGKYKLCFIYDEPCVI